MNDAMRVVTLLLLILLDGALAENSRIYSIDDNVVFENPNAPQGFWFEKLAIDPTTTRVFVGAVNGLYDLTGLELDVHRYVRTGPEDDTTACRDSRKRDECNEPLYKTNSFTKALAVYDKSSKLIECTNLYRGRCRLRNLHNISEVLSESSEQKIAYDTDSTVAIFVGSGPSNVTADPVLYVGSTAPANQEDQMSVYSANLRPSNRTFEVLVSGLYAGTSVVVDYLARNKHKYTIDYIGGFESGDYAYFATRQRSGRSDGVMESRLVRVCTGDTMYYSYTEVPLICRKNGTNFNLIQDIYVSRAGYDLAKDLNIYTNDPVVFGVFWEGDRESFQSQQPTGRSAVCIYTMKQVERVFRENIEKCYRGVGTKNLPWFSSTYKCLATKLNWDAIKCGTDVNSKIGGSDPIVATPALILDEEKMTAIAVNTTKSNTVAFVGTENGKVHKIRIEKRDIAEKYATEIVSSNEPILADMDFSGDGKSVYVMTPTKVVRMPSSRCESLAASCDVCLKQRDPYCGWCVNNNHCTHEDTCDRVVPHTSSGWLDFQNSACPTIRSVLPDKIQISESAEYLTISVENLQTSISGKRMQCLYHFPNGGKDVLSEPATFDGSLKCASPPKKKLPQIEADEHFIESQVQIVAEGSLLPLATSNISFYDCGRYTSCTTCANSQFPCDWCLESNECVTGKSTEDKCRRQHIVNGLNRDGYSRRKGPSKCPHIFAPVSKMAVPSGERRNISVKVQNIDSAFMGDFRCQFRIGATVHEKLAIKAADDTITCEEMLFDGQPMDGGSTNYGFNVLWSSLSPTSTLGHSFDNVNGLKIDVYSCESLASNCGLCLTLDDKYECGWCSAERRCARPGTCKSTRAEDWLDSTQLCPSPTIDDFQPRKGTAHGGTKVTITGTNLGRSVQDVASRVQVANVPCEVIAEEYVASTKIVCITGRLTLKDANRRGSVAVTLLDDSRFFAISNEQFAYVEPMVTSMKPAKGPRAGGTDITLTGTDLDAGSDVRIRFGTIDCMIMQRSANKITCRIAQSEEDGKFPLHMTFDEAPMRVKIPINFEFTSNPTITGIQPNRTIPSGGISIDVSGHGFSLLQRPRMMLVAPGGEKTTGPACQIHRDELLTCRTPSVPSTARDLMYEIDFDGAPSKSGRISVTPNPVVDVFSETRFFRPGDESLTITGNYLNQAANERDISVSVGGAPCQLTAFANKVLTCQPPSEKPPVPGDVQPEVVVRIGNSTHTVGELSYDAPGFSPSVYLIILAFIGIMVVLIICVLVAYRRKTNSHQRQMKYLKTQMDTIEMKVATECKEAFAELQTSLNQYTADLPLGTPAAPFLEYKEYCARVLFPNSNSNHPVLRNLEVDTTKAEAIEAGLREFHKLLMNKTFFLTMVRTMESNKYFVGKDRVYVGSLLMVVLQEKMGYCTEMLKQLLRELIERTVEKKFQPKILFRRSESVAERMLSAWFTFLMHDHLRNYDSGKKLYELFWGIKQQMEKGPQDALTLEARYSLSEEKLLRATFEYKVLTVFVVSSDEYGPQQTHDLPVRVLDCDTITQVKEKCIDAKYRGYRYSERPLASDVELEWRTGVNGRMILQDIDSSSRIEPGNWKRLNTLAHYNVPNNALLQLAPKSNSLYNLVNFSSCINTMSLLSDRSDKSSISLKNMSPSSNRPWGSGTPGLGATTSSSSTKDMDNGYKLYHLVKPSEHGPSDNQEKMVTEIYLTRLLMMKGTLQKFINDMLASIFTTTSSPLPACIKYMFDFMDEQSLEHGITDPEVVHAWKSNALPLRFWVNLIKNPHFLFDIQKPTKVEGCLSVVAQTLMDACSTQDHHLTKDSPSSKLLFAKDMYQYREWVDSYYTEISRLPPISDQEMGSLLSAESRQHVGEFQVFSALNELYKYLDQYKESILDALESNEHAQASRLPGRLQDLLALMESDFGRATDYESSTLGLGYNSNSRLMPRDRV